VFLSLPPLFAPPDYETGGVRFSSVGFACDHVSFCLFIVSLSWLVNVARMGLCCSFASCRYFYRVVCGCFNASRDKDREILEQ